MQISQRLFVTFSLVILPFMSVSTMVNAESLSLTEYLSQVKSGHQGLQAAQQNRDNARALSAEVEAPYAMQVFANAQQLLDKKETASPAFQGTETKAQSYNFGVSKKTSFGLNGKLSYDVVATEIIGANPQFNPGGKHYETRPSVELSQSLWRNGFGSETRAQFALANAQADAGEAGEDFKTRLILSEAEMAYWRLAVAREVTAAQTENLNRARRIYDWNKNRVNLSLADRADLLQADAALRFRELELTQAKSEERSAALAFNRMRNKENEAVSEGLDSISASKLETIEPPKKRDSRPDVKAAEASARMAESQAALTKEKYTPTLELFGTYAMNGRDETYGDANTESFDAKLPTTAIGLRINASLDHGMTSRQTGAARVQAAAAKLNADQKRFDVDREWDDLIQRFSDVKDKVRLARDIEKIQKEKLGYERERLQKGRSTTFQVLQFEGDFTTSQLNRIQAEAELLRLYAQLKTFGA